MGRLNNLQKNAGRWGWLRALMHVAARGFERYLGVHIYVVRSRKIPAEPVYPKSDPKFTIRKIEESEWAELCSDKALRLEKEFVDDAIDRGDLACGAFHGDKLVSYVWRSRSCAPDVDGVWISVEPPYCYSHNSFTRPDYRGQHINPVVHLFADNEMYQYNFRYRVGFVAITNYPSLELGKHMEAVVIGYAGFISALGLFIPFRAKSIKAIGFSFFRPNDAAQKRG